MPVRVVLLAAGRSFRMAPLSDKNFLSFFGKPLIQHQLEMLVAAGFQDILIVCGKHNLEPLETLRRHLHAFLERKKVKLEILEQKNLDLGMAGAILTAKRVWKKDCAMFLVSSNDLVESSIFEKMLRLSSSRAMREREGIFVMKKVESYFPGGYVVTNRKGILKQIVEKPGEGKEPSSFVNLVLHLYFRPELLFQYIDEASSLKDDRYESALQHWITDGGRFGTEIHRGFWQPVKYPWHILSLMHYFFSELKKMFPRGRVGGSQAGIAKTAKISGDVYLGNEVKVMDHAVIQGPCYIGDGTVIGTGSLVRESHVGSRCVIGFNSEIARSYAGNDCWFHTNYIGDSVIGNNVAFGSGTVTGNLRFDEGTIKVMVEKTWVGKKKIERVNTNMKKLGALVGENVRVGVNTSFMPGIKVGEGSFVGAGIVVAENIPAKSFARGEWKLKISKNTRSVKKRE